MIAVPLFLAGTVAMFLAFVATPWFLAWRERRSSGSRSLLKTGAT